MGVAAPRHRQEILCPFAGTMEDMEVCLVNIAVVALHSGAM